MPPLHRISKLTSSIKIWAALEGFLAAERLQTTRTPTLGGRYRHRPPSVGVRVVCKRSAAKNPSKAAQILIELVSLLILCSGGIHSFPEVYRCAARCAVRSREYVLCE